MIPTVINNDTFGAPGLRGETGSLYNVLKFALPQLGWTIEFDDQAASKIVFRNSPLATGNYLRISDDPSNHIGGVRWANVRSYSIMSGIDTGTDENGGDDWMIFKSYTEDAVNRPWYIIGDDVSFWLFIDAGGYGGYQWYYYGDLQSDRPGDEGAFMTWAGKYDANPSTAAFVGPMVGNTGVGGFVQLRSNFDRTIVGINANIDNEISWTEMTGSSGIYPEPATGGMRVIDRSIIEAIQGGHRRGRLRGWLDIMNNVVGVFDSGEIIVNQATPRGFVDCMVLRLLPRVQNTSGQGVTLIDVSTDWENW